MEKIKFYLHLIKSNPQSSHRLHCKIYSQISMLITYTTYTTLTFFTHSSSDNSVSSSEYRISYCYYIKQILLIFVINLQQSYTETCYIFLLVFRKMAFLLYSTCVFILDSTNYMKSSAQNKNMLQLLTIKNKTTEFFNSNHSCQLLLTSAFILQNFTLGTTLFYISKIIDH